MTSKQTSFNSYWLRVNLTTSNLPKDTEPPTKERNEMINSFNIKSIKKEIQCNNGSEKIRKSGLEMVDCASQLLDELFSIYNKVNSISPDKEIIESIKKQVYEIIDGRVTK